MAQIWQILGLTNPSTSLGGNSAHWHSSLDLKPSWWPSLKTFLYFKHFFLMFPCRLCNQEAQRSFAKYGHPGLFSQHQIRYDQILPRFCLFESVHKQAEKFAFNIECHESDELHSESILKKQIKKGRWGWRTRARTPRSWGRIRKKERKKTVKGTYIQVSQRATTTVCND